MVLELNDKEQEIVKRALETFEHELRDVLLKTDKFEARHELHDEEAMVKKILEKVTWH